MFQNVPIQEPPLLKKSLSKKVLVKSNCKKRICKKKFDNFLLLFSSFLASSAVAYSANKSTAPRYATVQSESEMMQHQRQAMTIFRKGCKQ